MRLVCRARLVERARGAPRKARINCSVAPRGPEHRAGRRRRGAGLGQIGPRGQRPVQRGPGPRGTLTTLLTWLVAVGAVVRIGKPSWPERVILSVEHEVRSGEVDGALGRCHAAGGGRVAVGAEVALPPRVGAAGDHEADPVARREAMGDRIELESDEAVRLACLEPPEALADVARAAVGLTSESRTKRSACGLSDRCASTSDGSTEDVERRRERRAGEHGDVGPLREGSIVLVAAISRASSSRPPIEGVGSAGSYVNVASLPLGAGSSPRPPPGWRCSTARSSAAAMPARSRHWSAPVTNTLTGVARVRSPAPPKCSANQPSASVTMRRPPLVIIEMCVHGPTVSPTSTPRRQPLVLLERLREEEVLPAGLEEHRHLHPLQRSASCMGAQNGRPDRAA